MKFEQEFKDAISNLSSIEKDRLILRLLKKDYILANRLYFELVSTNSVEEQREMLQQSLEQKIENRSKRFHSCGYLNTDMRLMSGEITEHVKITKDKYGEVALNLFLLIEILEKNKENIIGSTYGQAYKFCVGVIARSFKIMILIKKLHEDYLSEFRSDLEKLGALIVENPYLIKLATYNGLDVNWLFNEEIPDDIELIQKDLRAQGLLR